MVSVSHPLVITLEWYRRRLGSLRELLNDMLASQETKVKAARADVEALLREDAEEAAAAELLHIGAPGEVRCRSCFEKIHWIRTKNGKPAPFNPKRLLVTNVEGQTFMGYESHYSSCPKAAEWRK